MRKYAQIVDGKVWGIFEYEKLPEFAPDIIMVDITDLDQEIFPDMLYDAKTNTFVEPPKPTLEELKQEKLEIINSLYQDKMNKLKSQYPQDEIKTWDTQRNEWQEWIKDTENAKTPFVDKLAEARGISRETLLNKIGEKVLLIAKLTGKRQALEDKINSAKTEEELNSIKITFEE